AIELRTDLPAEAIVMAAPIRIKQALVNLIDNGIKYTPSGGRVTVSVAFSAGGDGAETVTIRVADTGLGIPARDLPHVFDKFYRVNSTATQGIAGTGLGLAITKTIVESVGGRIRVESVEVAGPGPAAPIARLGQAWDRAAGALQNLGRLVQAHVGAQQLRLHRMLRLVVGERPREREPARLGTRVAPARQIEIHEVRAPERS